MVTRRKLVSTSEAANTGMHSTANIAGRASDQVTLSFWWQWTEHPGGSTTMWAGDAGQYQVFHAFSGSTSYGLRARMDGTNAANAGSGATGEWVFFVVHFGLNHDGTNDVVVKCYDEDGTAKTVDGVVTGSNSSTEITTAGTHWLVGDDGTSGFTDPGCATDGMFDVCFFDGIIAVSDLQIDTTNGGWKDLTTTAQNALVYRIDGQNASDPGEDSSGNNNDFTVENSGVTLSLTGLPTGANPTATDSIARPDGTVTTGNWRTDAAGTDLHTAIDEVTASDVDYIESGSNPSADLAEVSLGSMNVDTSGDVTVRYRYYKTGGSTINLTVRLVEGVTTIASQTHNGIGGSVTAGSFTLSTAEKAAVSNWNSVALEFEATAV